ncbi:23S rRNA (guanosine(2251)-2'-O)-methyltransferase RlmB [Stella sp.]|uniref:23S rRNA (guanosine(2251)-2'-O)-methyltransferase RlmB n=1 Tax=Stella sp. TaxID=2912054 RepID=UPI0035AEAD97
MKPKRPNPAGKPPSGRPEGARPPDRRRTQPPPGASAQGWLWGHHPVAAALANPARTCRRLLTTPDSAAALAAALAALPEARRPRTETVERAALDRLLPPGSVHQGVALLADPLPPVDLDRLLDALPADAPATLVLLDQVTDPHNIGAVLRSAAAFGAAAVILPDRHAPPVTGTLAKTASGAVEVVPLVRVVNLARTIAELQEAGFLCIGLAEEGETALVPGRPAERIAIALGAEGDGLRRLTRERCDRLVRLPTRAPIGSLNVSNAAAVALFALLPAA